MEVTSSAYHSRCADDITGLNGLYTATPKCTLEFYKFSGHNAVHLGRRYMYDLLPHITPSLKPIFSPVLSPGIFKERTGMYLFDGNGAVSPRDRVLLLS